MGIMENDMETTLGGLLGGVSMLDAANPKTYQEA